MRSALALALLFAACAPTAQGTPPPLPSPRITAVASPQPSVTGTILRVRGLDLDRCGSPAQLIVTSPAGEQRLGEQPDGLDDARPFAASAELVAALGDGTHDVTLVVRGPDAESEPFDTRLTLASSLPLSLDTAPTGSVHFEDLVVLHGAGFTTEGEGAVRAHVVGTFTPSGGSATSIDASLPVTLADLGARDRAVLVLTTDLAGVGLAAGTLSGTLALDSTLASGEARSTPPVPIDLAFVPPELFALDPSTASVGRIVTVRGAGFLGRPERTTETTLLRVSGTFTPAGGAAAPFSMELVPSWISGAEVGLVLAPHVQNGMVVASPFDAQRGVLAATATPIALRGTTELAGAATPFTLTLGAPRQVVELRFLPGWYDSLARFGLAAARAQIVDAIVQRMESIYAGHAIDVRTAPVTDFADSAYAVIEIGGPDPNGSGLFGYDNSPGKDVGNLRLFDHIGGANAETQADGYPGYGGVFVESMLWWSSHPELPGSRPASAPDADPLFDEVFDAVRAHPASYDEAMGVGGASRVRSVDRAVHAFASLVGETAAHELGHSLGLAQPYGDPTAFHNDTDGDGCLMDRGSDRPLGERMAEPGFTASHLCYEEDAYLSEILAAE
jgi:hypothetical protein